MKQLPEDLLKKIQRAFAQRGTTEVHIRYEEGKPVVLAVRKTKIDR